MMMFTFAFPSFQRFRVDGRKRFEYATCGRVFFLQYEKPSPFSKISGNVQTRPLSLSGNSVIGLLIPVVLDVGLLFPCRCRSLMGLCLFIVLRCGMGLQLRTEFQNWNPVVEHWAFIRLTPNISRKTSFRKESNNLFQNLTFQIMRD